MFLHERVQIVKHFASFLIERDAQTTGIDVDPNGMPLVLQPLVSQVIHVRVRSALDFAANVSHQIGERHRLAQASIAELQSHLKRFAQEAFEDQASRLTILHESRSALADRILPLKMTHRFAFRRNFFFLFLVSGSVVQQRSFQNSTGSTLGSFTLGLRRVAFLRIIIEVLFQILTPSIGFPITFVASVLGSFISVEMHAAQESLLLGFAFGFRAHLVIG